MNDYNETDLIETLSELGLQYRQKGKELQLEKCPFCENDRPKSSDHFSFRRDDGVFNCIKCGTKGNLYTFRREMGINPWKDKQYQIPNQEIVKSYTKQPETYFKAYEKARGIPESILVKYGVGRASYGSLGECRTYQYVDTDGTVVNVKYVNAKKQMVQEKNARQIYYGMQFIKFDESVLHITEGEDDCHALVAMGFDNVVSVPGGSKSYSEQMGQINSKFKKLILFFDNDKAGQDGAEAFAQKAGVWKCFNVILPFKDVRDCLLHGIEFFGIQQLINKSKQFKYSVDVKLRPALNISERLDRFEEDSLKNERGLNFGYDVIDEITGGLRGGDLFSVVANPGCFKTTTLMNIMKRAVEKTSSGMVTFFSLEMQIEAEVERELQMYSMFPPYMLRKFAKEKKEEWKRIRGMVENHNYNRIYVSEESNTDLDGILKIIERTEEVSGEKCILAGIDYLDFVGSKNQKEYDSVKEVMLGIKRIAKIKNIPTIVLAQTNRDNKESDEEVGLRSGKGGTAIEATSDFYIGIWRSGERIVGRMSKHRRMVGGEREYPYLSFDIDKKNYLINDICICEKPIGGKNKDCEKNTWNDH
jgi:CRISPR/Cas system-associated exonuclease Cas4 (RecB family)